MKPANILPRISCTTLGAIAELAVMDIFLTYTVALEVPVEARSTSRFGAAPERALCVHALEVEPTVMALLHTLIDV